MTRKYVVWYCETYKSFVFDYKREGFHEVWGCCTEINSFEKEGQAYDLCNFLNWVCLND